MVRMFLNVQDIFYNECIVELDMMSVPKAIAVLGKNALPLTMVT